MSLNLPKTLFLEEIYRTVAAVGALFRLTAEHAARVGDASGGGSELSKEQELMVEQFEDNANGEPTVCI